MFYFAYNPEIQATSFKHVHYKNAHEEMKRLQDVFPPTWAWKVLSNQPQLTPEQCCPWIKTGSPSKAGADDDLYA